MTYSCTHMVWRCSEANEIAARCGVSLRGSTRLVIELVYTVAVWLLTIDADCLLTPATLEVKLRHC